MVVFAIHQHESALGVHVSHHPEPHFHLPPYPTPLGYPRVPALDALIHILNLYWSSILHMVIYMFQCYSLISSNPRLLPHTPKVCSLPDSLPSEPPGKPMNTGVGSLSHLQGIFLTQELNRDLLHCRRILYQLNY